MLVINTSVVTKLLVVHLVHVRNHEMCGWCASHIMKLADWGLRSYCSILEDVPFDKPFISYSFVWMGGTALCGQFNILPTHTQIWRHSTHKRR